MDLKEAIDLDREATQLIKEIDSLIWETTNEVFLKTKDKWNLSYFLHHEIIRYFSQVISPNYGYGKPSFEHLKKEGKLCLDKRINPIYYSSYFCHEWMLLSKFSSLLKYFLNFIFGLRTGKRKSLNFYAYSYEKQLFYLNQLFKSISNLIKNKTNNKDYNFEEFLSIYNIKVTEANLLNLLKFPKIFLVGSRLLLFNRYLICMCRKANFFVISSTHSHATIFYNDINWYYGDFTGGNIQYEYGTPYIVPHRKNLYTVKRRIFRSSKVVKKLINNSKLKKSINRSSNRVIYAPTVLSGKNFYFPKRQYPDHIYIKHWEFILESSPYIDIAIHPKTGQTYPSLELINFKKKWFSRITSSPLKTLLNEDSYNTFIVDHISTTSTEILASRKNLIYLDIHLRDLDEEYFKAFSKENHVISYEDLYSKSSILQEKIDFIQNNNFHDIRKSSNLETDYYSILKN